MYLWFHYYKSCQLPQKWILQTWRNLPIVSVILARVSMYIFTAYWCYSYSLVFPAVAYLAVLILIVCLPAVAGLGCVLVLVCCYKKKQKTSNGKCHTSTWVLQCTCTAKIVGFLLLNRQTPIYTTRRRTQVSGYMHGFVLIDVHWHMYSSVLILLLHCQTIAM